MFCLHTRTRWLVVNVSRFLKCRFKILICIDIFIYKVFVLFVPFIFVVAVLTSISFCSHSVWPFSLLCFVINCVSYCSHFVSFSIVILHHANGDFVCAFFITPLCLACFWQMVAIIYVPYSSKLKKKQQTNSSDETLIT